METTLDMIKDIAPKFVVTVKFVGLKKWRIRFWIARQLFRLGAMVSHMGIKFEDKPYYGADL